MELRILGSGSAAQSVDRGSAGYLLQACGKIFLIDAGPGTCRQLSRYGIDVGSIDDIFISHFHVDHVNDLPAILFTRKHCLNEEPKNNLAVHGPSGFHVSLKNLLLSYGSQIISDDYKLKVIEHRKPEPEEELRAKASKERQQVKRKETKKNEEKEENYLEEVESELFYRSGRVKVTMAEMEHSAPSLGFRFEYNSQPNGEEDAEPDLEENKADRPVKSFTYSGDTSPCSNIIKLATKTDCLLMEATASDNAPLRWHTTTSQAGAVAKKAGVKTLVLTHISPENDETDIENIASQFYDGIVIAARDGMRLTI